MFSTLEGGSEELNGVATDIQDDWAGDLYDHCEHPESKALSLPAELREMADDRDSDELSDPGNDFRAEVVHGRLG